MSGNPVKVDDLRQVGAFLTLNNPQLDIISKVMVRRKYTPGQFIFFEGEQTAGVWFVLSGTVKIIKRSMGGRLQGLCLMNSGKCFGNCPLFENDTNPADAQAADHVLLGIIPRDSLLQLIERDGEIARCLLDIYNQQIHLLARLGECLGVWPLGMRIEDCLITHAQPTEDHFVLQLTHEEIATIVGTAREVVTRHLLELENQEIIRTQPGQIQILNMEGLKRSRS